MSNLWLVVLLYLCKLITSVSMQLFTCLYNSTIIDVFMCNVFHIIIFCKIFSQANQTFFFKNSFQFFFFFFNDTLYSKYPQEETERSPSNENRRRKMRREFFFFTKVIHETISRLKKKEAISSYTVAYVSHKNA